jgi:NAD+--asparagine ADP-ribosyltransferase
MDQDFNILDDRTDKDLIEKTFFDIDTFREKYSIDQFILDEDLEARLQKLNVQVLSELPEEKTGTTETIIRDFEAKIKARKTEKAYLFDTAGNVLLEKGGTKNQVSFTNEEVKQFKGAILTHNHPGASSFSMQDIRTACMNELMEIRATGTYRTYVMKTKDGSNLKPDLWKYKIKDAYEIHNTDVRRDFMSRIDKGELSIKDAELLHGHEVWTRTAKDILDLKYSFIEEKP